MGQPALILLDTHALVWWVSDPGRLPPRARRAIDAAISATTPVMVSSISAWEIMMLVTRGRLELTMDVETWISHVESLPFLTFVPVDNRVAMRAVRLDDFAHRDPADRMILATAAIHHATVVTADQHLRAYRPIQTLWD